MSIELSIKNILAGPRVVLQHVYISNGGMQENKRRQMHAVPEIMSVLALRRLEGGFSNGRKA